jgi:hypothetical protein
VVLDDGDDIEEGAFEDGTLTARYVGVNVDFCSPIQILNLLLGKILEQHHPCTLDLWAAASAPIRQSKTFSGASRQQIAKAAEFP